MSVTWETALRDYQENVTNGQTHGQTDGQTPDKVIPMCRYASQATQKPQHLKKKWLLKLGLTHFWIRIYSEFHRDLFSANTMYIYMVSFF